MEDEYMITKNGSPIRTGLSKQEGQDIFNKIVGGKSDSVFAIGVGNIFYILEPMSENSKYYEIKKQMKTYRIKKNNEVIFTGLPEAHAMEHFLNILNKGEDVKTTYHDINNPTPVECRGDRYQITEEERKTFSEKLEEKSQEKEPYGFKEAAKDLSELSLKIAKRKRDRELKLKCVEVAAMVVEFKHDLLPLAKELFEYINNEDHPEPITNEVYAKDFIEHE